MGYRWGAGFRIPWGTVGRPAQVSGGRAEVVSTRLSREEKVELDKIRGSLSASVYLRLLVKAAIKRGGV